MKRFNGWWGKSAPVAIGRGLRQAQSEPAVVVSENPVSRRRT